MEDVRESVSSRETRSCLPLKRFITKYLSLFSIYMRIAICNIFKIMFTTTKWIRDFSSKNIVDHGITNTKAFRLKVLRDNMPLDSKADERQASQTETELSGPYASYTRNSEKEEACIANIDFWISSMKRKGPWFVVAHNEFLIPKCVCTTISPTVMPVHFLSHHNYAETCARHLALYMEYEPLVVEPIRNNENGFVPSNALVSPTQALEWGIGDCFDLATLLVSFLLGAGYDAYVVHGSAPTWIRNKNETGDNVSAWLDGSHDSITAIQHLERLLQSTCESNSLGGSLRDNDLQNRLEENWYSCNVPLRKESKPVEYPDTTLGQHGWVFVRNDTRSPSIDSINGRPRPQSYFLEPSTGQRFSLDEPCPYKDVYSMWNHKNYWIQTGADSPLSRVFLEFSNNATEFWAPVFSTKNSSNILKDEQCRAERLPVSWIRNLHSTADRRFRRDQECPFYGQRKIIIGHNFQVEVFIESDNQQGLEKRVTVYLDAEKNRVGKILEFFRPNSRSDNMQLRIRVPDQFAFHEKYFYSNAIGIEGWYEIIGQRRVIQFRPYSRVDGLIERDESYGLAISDKFHDRLDGMCKREIHFKDDGMSDEGSEELNSGPLSRTVQRIMIQYAWDHRQRVTIQSGGEIIASRMFLLEEKRVITQFFNEDGSLSRHTTSVCYTNSRRSILENYNNDERNFKKDLSSILSSIRGLHYEMQEICTSREK